MRIATLADFPIHVIPQFCDQVPKGHYATWLPQLAQAFEKHRDLDIHWLFVTRQPVAGGRVSWLGQTFHPLYVPGKLRALRLYRRDCKALKQRLDEIRPDLVHAWGNEDCYGLAATLSGHRSLLSVQGLLSHYIQQVKMHPLVRLQAYYERFVLRRMKLITAESPWACEMVRPYAPDAEIRRVEYGVPELFFETKWTPAADKPVAIFVGTPEPRKGIQDAISAFANPRLSFAELWVVGNKDGAFAQELLRRSTPNVKWLGRHTPEQTAKLMSQAWCLVIPTRADTGPTVVKEARVIGLPVITTTCGGQRDYIRDGESGFFAEPGNVMQLSDHLVRVLTERDITLALGRAYHEEDRTLFLPSATAASFLAIYRETGTGGEGAKGHSRARQPNGTIRS